MLAGAANRAIERHASKRGRRPWPRGSGREVLARHAPDLLLDDLGDAAGLVRWARALDLEESRAGAGTKR